MWMRSASKIFNDIQVHEVWQAWSNINRWHEWHHDLDYCRLEGEFKQDNHFILKPKGGPKVKIELTDIQIEKSFTDCTCFLGAQMIDTHTIEQTDIGLKLTNTVVVRGPLRWLWVKLVAQGVANSAHDELQALHDYIIQQRSTK